MIKTIMSVLAIICFFAFVYRSHVNDVNGMIHFATLTLTNLGYVILMELKELKNTQNKP